MLPRMLVCSLGFLVILVDATTFDAEGWAAAQSSAEKEVFLKGLVTQELHGSVQSDEALKAYALVAPKDYDLLLSQLKLQPWLCGGTGRPCDVARAATNWQTVVGGKDPNTTAVLAENLLRQHGMQVTNKAALLDWARFAPLDVDTALTQLKGASFTCGGSGVPCHHAFAAGDPVPELTLHQSRAVLTGTIAFICLCIVVAVLIVIAYAIVLEDKKRATSHDLQMQVRNSKLKYQHTLALQELASASSMRASQEGRIPLVPAVNYMAGPPLAAGYPDVRQMGLVSPAYSSRGAPSPAACYAPAPAAMVYSRG